MKKRLLAGLLSFTMLTAEVLPVIAADDAVVSENAVVEEDETDAEAVIEEDATDAEEAVIEEDAVVEEEEVELTPEEEAIFDNLEAGERYEVKDGNNTIVYELLPVDNVLSSISVAEDTDNYQEESVYDATTTSHIYATAYKTATLTADPIEINGKVYYINSTVGFNSRISYRAKKVKADKLNPTITSSSLYDIANALVPSGTKVSSDVIKWKFSIKKNKLANKGAYFTVKASVATKVAKQYGITGKALKVLKKAVSKFNKVAKKKENRIAFNIDAINLDPILFDSSVCQFWYGSITTIYSNGGISVRKIPTHIRLRLDESQPEVATKYNYTKWTKPSKKDVKLVKLKDSEAELYGYWHYQVTPMNKNYTGTPYTDVYLEK